MLRSTTRWLPSLALLLAPANLAAQNLFEIYPSRPDVSANSATRLTVPPTAGGELLVEVPDSTLYSYFRGVGEDCQQCRIDQIQVELVDTFPLTPSAIRVVVRPNVLVDGGPVTGAAPPGSFKSGWFATPTLAQFTMVVNFTACFPIPCTGGFSIGVELPAGTAADHLRVVTADHTAAWPSLGDYIRSTAPTFAWDLQAPPLFLGPPTLAPGTSLRIAARTCSEAPVLNMGNLAILPRLPAWDTSFGVGGMCPDADVGRGDGLKGRVKHLPAANGLAALFVSPIAFPVGVSFGCNTWYLGVPLVNLGVFPLNNVGEGVAMVLPPEVRGWLVGKKLWFQALTADSTFTVLKTSNAQAVQW